MPRCETYDAAIIGGGVAGSVVAAILARTARTGYRAVLFDARRPGSGTAYATPSGRLLMNGPARAMGVVPGDETDLVRWLSTESPDEMIARSRFGEYVRDHLERALAGHPGVSVRCADVVDIDFQDGYYVLTDAGGNSHAARSVVLALGNFAPDDAFLPEAVRQHDGYHRNPWSVDGTQLDGDGVALIGSGLTAMDVIALLEEANYRGRIHLISRHGLLPQIEDPLVNGLDPRELGLDYATPYELLKTLRAAAERNGAAGGDWRAIVDSIRSISPVIWSRWPQRERRKFLRHLQSFWSVHRYRVPAQTHAAFERFAASGTIVRHRGRVRDALQLADGRLRIGVVRADWRTTVDVDRVVNCTGPQSDYARNTHPLVQNAVRRGLLRPDSLRLGIDASERLRVLDAAGRPQERLFTLGPPLRGLYYESTGVPETKAQAARVAAELLAQANVLPMKVYRDRIA